MELEPDQILWATFEAVEGHTYEIETTNLSGGADTILYLHDSNSDEPNLVDDDGGDEPLGSRITWIADQDVRVHIAVQDVNAQAAYFDLLVRESVEQSDGT